MSKQDECLQLGDTIEIEVYEAEDDESRVSRRRVNVRTKQLPRALIGSDTEVRINGWTVLFFSQISSDIIDAEKDLIRICTGPFQRVLSQDAEVWEKYKDKILETISKLNEVMKLDPARGVSFQGATKWFDLGTGNHLHEKNVWLNSDVGFADFIQIQVLGDDRDNFYMKVGKMPYQLLDVSKSVIVGSWQVELSPFLNTGMSVHKKKILIRTNRDFIASAISSDAWHTHHAKIEQTIRFLNKMMKIDPEKGVQFNEDDNELSLTKRKKFEFSGEGIIHRIQ